jgi:hypothetical protein
MTFNRHRVTALLGTGVVAVHAIPLVVHSAAHIRLGILFESILPNAYIAVVLFILPVVACTLLWFRAAARAGAWLLLWSMAGSLGFEVFNHFLMMSPDHVSQVPEDIWGRVFVQTAVASAILEAVGIAVAVYLLCVLPKQREAMA